MSTRFVIQLHSTPEGEHYDLMLEDGDALATWRLERSEATAAVLERHEGKQGIDAIELPRHRLAYLDYEGPLGPSPQGADRGQVKIADKGEFSTLARQENEWQFTLHGEVTTGRFAIRRLDGPRWRLQPLPD